MENTKKALKNTVSPVGIVVLGGMLYILASGIWNNYIDPSDSTPIAYELFTAKIYRQFQCP